MRALAITLAAGWLFFAGASAGAAALTNQLKQHASPYLALHGADPVAWQDWNEAAVTRARRENKLLYLSIGYFSCHWCHVMQRESYQNADIARLLNDRFVPVKIDRELEPALDARMSEFAEATRGMSGWPLNVFLTPDGHPLYALLYAPPAEFHATLKKLDALWIQDPATLRRLALAEARPARGPGPARVDAAVAEAYARKLVDEALARADAMHGGFGDQSKFPSVPILEFLLSRQASHPSPALAELLARALDAMADLGLRDHLGGGFFRYTVDPGWKTPHFEKMLYDNALLARLYLRAAQVLAQPRYAAIARDTLDFMQREMRDASGAFVASLSALDGAGIEGGFYLWDAQTLDTLLDVREREVFRLAYGMTDAAPFEAGHLPIPSLEPSAIAARLQLETGLVQTVLAQAEQKLRSARTRRDLPRDTKRLAGWNGLALSAYATAAHLTGDAGYRRVAEDVAEHLTRELWDGKRLRRAVERGRAVGAASLEDYAYVAEGLRDFARLTEAPADHARARRVAGAAWETLYTSRGWRLAERSLIAAEVGQDIVADGPLPSPSAVLIDVSLALDESQKGRRRALGALNSGHALLKEDPFWYATHINVLQRVARPNTAHTR